MTAEYVVYEYTVCWARGPAPDRIDHQPVLHPSE